MKKLITIILISSVFGCYGQEKIESVDLLYYPKEDLIHPSLSISEISNFIPAGDSLGEIDSIWGRDNIYLSDDSIDQIWIPDLYETAPYPYTKLKGKSDCLIDTTETPPISLSFKKDTTFYYLYIENDSLKYGGDLPLSESAKTFMEYCDEYWYSKIDSLEDELQKSKEIKESPLVFTQVGSSFDKTRVSDLVKLYKESCSVHEEYTYLVVYSSLDSVRINNYRYKRLADGLYSIFSIDLKEGTGELPTLDGFVRWAYENGY